MTPFVYAEQHTCGSTYGEDTRSVRRHDARKGKKEKKIIYIYIYIIPLVKTVLIMITVHKVLVSYLLHCFTNFRWLRTGTC